MLLTLKLKMYDFKKNYAGLPFTCGSERNMQNTKTRKLIMAALMAALTCIATMVIKVPSPTGYIHLGDGLVLLSGIILGPLYGGAAAGIGSMFADLFLGYAGFAPATLVIKALAAITGSIIYHFLAGIIVQKKARIAVTICAGIGGGIVVTLGYFIFEGYIMGLGYAAAASSVPFNLVQNAFGIIVSSLLLPVLVKVPVVRELTAEYTI